MAAKVINFHSPDGKNTYELTFTRESAEATERNGFQIYEFSNGINPVKTLRLCSTAHSLPATRASSESWLMICLRTSKTRKV